MVRWFRRERSPAMDAELREAQQHAEASEERAQRDLASEKSKLREEREVVDPAIRQANKANHLGEMAMRALVRGYKNGQ